MNNLLKQLTLLKSEKLSLHEREAMRAKIVMLMEKQTAKAEYRNGMFAEVMQYKRAVGFTLASLLAMSTGASYAAASSLPGDILYPIKIHVNERIEGAIAQSPKASAEFAQKQISRRAVEAEILREQDRFDDVKKNQLAEETKTHIDAYAEARTKIENQGGRALALELEGKMHRTIKDHESAFSDMGVAVIVGTSTDGTEDAHTTLEGHRSGKEENLHSIKNREENDIPALGQSSEPSKNERLNEIFAPTPIESNVSERLKNRGERGDILHKTETQVEVTSPTEQKTSEESAKNNIQE